MPTGKILNSKVFGNTHNPTFQDDVKHGSFFSRSPFAFSLGFTLTEVLITLGIIGVVAAMTIPTLVNNYQKNVYTTSFKKAVSSLENAVKMVEVSNNCIGTECATSAVAFQELLFRQFSGATWINEVNQDLCNHVSLSYYYDGSNTEGPRNFCQDQGPGTNGFVTIDGMLITAADQGIGGGWILDTNGTKKGPNIMGRDIWNFYIPYRLGYSSDERIIINQVIWTGGTKESILAGDSTSFSWKNSCNDEKKEGWSCAARILEEGEMNY